MMSKERIILESQMPNIVFHSSFILDSQELLKNRQNHHRCFVIHLFCPKFID